MKMPFSSLMKIPKPWAEWGPQASQHTLGKWRCQSTLPGRLIDTTHGGIVFFSDQKKKCLPFLWMSKFLDNLWLFLSILWIVDDG